jgi:TonB family protein
MMPVANDPNPVAAEPPRAARQRRVEVVVVSSADEFLIELGPLLSEGYRTRPVDSPAGVAAVAADQAQDADAPPSMIMLDATSVSDPRAAAATLATAHPQMPIIVVVTAREDSVWSGAIARGAIVDVILREELTGERFKQALSRAQTHARAAPQAASPDQTPPGPKGNAKLLIGAAVAIGIAAAAFFFFHRAAPAPDAMASKVTGSDAGTPGAVTPPRAQSVLELLSNARVAFRDQKLLPHADGELRGDSVLELYSQVLVQDSKNDEAVDGLQRLFSVIKSRVQADLAANKLDDASRLIALFKATNLDSDAVHELEASITAARPRFYAARAQESIAANDFVTAEQVIQQLMPLDHVVAAELRRTMEARKTEQQTVGQLTTLSAAVKAAIEAGNLLEPANDNARTRLLAMRQVGRSHPLTLAAQRDLLGALIGHAQDLASKEQFDQAAKILSAAADIAATPEVADAKRQLQGQLDAVNQRAAAAAAAKKAAEVTQASTQSTDEAASAARASAAQFIAGKPTQALKVVYPPSASAKSQQGYVVVEFMLQPDGRPAQPTIIESDPPRVFDAAAIDAVMSGRYDTSKLVNNTPRRARVRLSFRPS